MGETAQNREKNINKKRKIKGTSIILTNIA